jgi:hypothetical protein
MPRAYLKAARAAELVRSKISYDRVAQQAAEIRKEFDEMGLADVLTRFDAMELELP